LQDYVFQKAFFFQNITRMGKQMINDIRTEGKTDIVQMIRDENVQSCFQPIVSIAKRSIVGLEGLIRGLTGSPGEYVSPLELFETAERVDMTIELDRLCRWKTIRAFSEYYYRTTDYMLFLNIDSSVIDRVGGSNYLLKQTKEYGINPERIIIEINESKVTNTDSLVDFVKRYRSYGFLIAVDDLGTGFSNLDRVTMIRPEIIKIDRQLVSNLNRILYKQEVFKSLISLANRIGALVIAEGVEQISEVLSAMELGSHMQQGYYFSKPLFPSADVKLIPSVIMEETMKNYRIYMKDKAKVRHGAISGMNFVLDGIYKLFCEADFERFNELLEMVVNSNRGIECAYILDGNGLQVSETVCLKRFNNKKDSLYKPASRGFDHSSKKYYYELIYARMNKYITEPYTSLASGSRCITISKIFRDLTNRRFVLCLDFVDV
jgi:EAL domain-containing protein (putative c-di-GMP-specific phosphodiesterase class I)